MAFQLVQPSYSPSLSTITNANLSTMGRSSYEAASHGEAGVAHDVTDFDTYYKFTTTSLDGGYSWVMFTSAGTGVDEVVLPPSDASFSATREPIMNGSGVYIAVEIAVPTYDNSVTYLVASDHHVYYNGAIYKCLQNALNKNPATETAYWEEVEDDDINSKYRQSVTFAYMIIIEADFAEMGVNVTAEGIGIFRKDLLASPNFQKASKVWLMWQAVDNLSARGLWTNCDEIIAYAKELTGE